jgi:hypothetical protein
MGYQYQEYQDERKGKRHVEERRPNGQTYRYLRPIHDTSVVSRICPSIMKSAKTVSLWLFMHTLEHRGDES